MSDQRPTESSSSIVPITMMDIALFAIAAFGVISAIDAKGFTGRQGEASGGMICAALAIGFLGLTRAVRGNGAADPPTKE